MNHEPKNMSTVKKYLSLVKFSHTIFALPFAMIGFMLGVKALQGTGGPAVWRSAGRTAGLREYSQRGVFQAASGHGWTD